MIRTTLALLLAGATAFSAPAARRDLSDDMKVARVLKDLVPGEPRSCINPSPSGGSEHYGNTALMKDRGGTLYRSQFQNGCEAPEEYALITRQFGTSLCRGDIVEVKDLTSGMSRGSCVFSEFVPYRKPKARH